MKLFCAVFALTFCLSAFAAWSPADEANYKALLAEYKQLRATYAVPAGTTERQKNVDKFNRMTELKRELAELRKRRAAG